MKKVAILSSNTNPDYLTLLPLVAKSWFIQGWSCYIVIESDTNNDDEILKEVIAQIMLIDPNNQVEIIESRENKTKNDALFIQVERLYQPQKYMSRNKLNGNEVYFILSDADMFIASSFLNRDLDKINSFGHDLTGYGEIPMCYVGMSGDKWIELMKYDSCGIVYDLENYSKSKSDIWEEAWGADQQILTFKLKDFGFDKVNFINRGHDQNNSGLPNGRLDRYNWQYPTIEIHDCHLFRNPLSESNYPLLKEMCGKIYPSQNWDWLDTFRNNILNINQKK